MTRPHLLSLRHLTKSYGPGLPPVVIAHGLFGQGRNLGVLARALADQPVLLLLDEVAAHLDAGRRALLYQALLELPAQSWLTGTGRELFDLLDKCSRLVHVRREGEASVAEDES